MCPPTYGFSTILNTSSNFVPLGSTATRPYFAHHEQCFRAPGELIAGNLNRVDRRERRHTVLTLAPVESLILDEIREVFAFPRLFAETLDQSALGIDRFMGLELDVIVLDRGHACRRRRCNGRPIDEIPHRNQGFVEEDAVLRRQIEITVGSAIADRSACDADRRHAGLPRPAIVLCVLAVADPLDGHGAGQGQELIPDLQVFDRTLADRSQHARSPQQTGHSSLSAAIARAVIAPVVIAPGVTAVIGPVVIAAECVSRLTAHRQERNSRGPGCHDPEQPPACADVSESLHSDFFLAPSIYRLCGRAGIVAVDQNGADLAVIRAPVRATNAYGSGWFQLKQPPLPQAAGRL